jgi:DNA-binding response OmpR family regulator
VIRDGRPIDLSPKEFGLLGALMRSESGTLSAETLLAQVWDENADPFTRTVQVTIGRLRRRLGEPQAIQTIPESAIGSALEPSGSGRERVHPLCGPCARA